MKLLVLLLTGLCTSIAWGQDFVCGYEPPSESERQQAVRSPASYRTATISPLVLFGKFSDAEDPFVLDDDNYKDREGNETRSATQLFDSTIVGSLAHYFYEMSYGTLTIAPRANSVVTKWYESQGANLAAYNIAADCTSLDSECGSNDPCNERRTVWSQGLRMFVGEVLDAANADPSINLSNYDLISVITPQAFSSACKIDGAVLHRITTNNGVSLSKVVTADQRRNFPLLVGTLAHEYGHVMDLPELYDRNHHSDTNKVNHSAGIGHWGVMGRGAAGWQHTLINAEGDAEGPIFDGPNSMSAWSRAKVGWLSPTTVTSDRSNIEIGDIDLSSRNAYKISISDSEYFLVANRQKQSVGKSYDYDKYAPASGLAIWHIDEDAQRNDNDANEHEKHKRVDLECADGLFTDQGYPGTMPNSVIGGDNLDYWHDGNPQQFNGNAGDATDLWDGSSYSAFTPHTNPSTAGYQADGEPATKQQNVFSGIYIENIAAGSNGAMTFDVYFAPLAPNSLDKAVGEDRVTLGWEPPSANGARVGSYKVRYHPSNSTSELDWMEEPLLRASSRSHTVTGLTTDQEYTFEVLAISDNDKEGAAVSINATPQINIVGPTDRRFDENSDKMVGRYEKSGPFHWSLEGIDADAFKLEGTGGFRELWFKEEPPDYENPIDTPTDGDELGDNVYHVTVKTTSVGPNRQEHRYMKEVEVVVLDVEEKGTLTIRSDGDEVSADNRPKVGTELTATLTDPDGGVSGKQWQWSRVDPLLGYEPNDEIIPGATFPEYTPENDDVGRTLRVKVDYTDRRGPGKNSSKLVDVFIPPGGPEELTAEGGASPGDIDVEEAEGDGR